MYFALLFAHTSQKVGSMSLRGAKFDVDNEAISRVELKHIVIALFRASAAMALETCNSFATSCHARNMERSVPR